MMMLKMTVRGKGAPGLWAGLALAYLLPLGSETSLIRANASDGCPPTAADSEGPFYEPNAPVRAQTGKGLKVIGRVQSAGDCEPLAGARIEWWSANRQGTYTDALRATVRTDADGAYQYETVSPSGYSFRPPHLHVKVSATGHRTLTTQIYPERGQNEIEFVFNLVPE